MQKHTPSAPEKRGVFTYKEKGVSALEERDDSAAEQAEVFSQEKALFTPFTSLPPMGDLKRIPEGYRPTLCLTETERAIKFIKDDFEQRLARALTLTRVSAPLFVPAKSGLNDNLSGVERPVRFDAKETGEELEIVQSLAKWKRQALHRYGFSAPHGIYTDMNAVRRDERTDALHSLYVDQWDWEKVIAPTDRNEQFLKQTVQKIYAAILACKKDLEETFDISAPFLPNQIAFISSQELEDAYPDLSPEEREYAFVCEHGAAFIMQIGGKLRSGKRHGSRAPDYDDWLLNGDIVVHYPLLGCAMELSSMGIRVNPERLVAQLKELDATDRLLLPFQRELQSGVYPQTMGGGIGQSRLCTFLLGKAHIGEVQSSVWPEETVAECREKGVPLL